MMNSLRSMNEAVALMAAAVARVAEANGGAAPTQTSTIVAAASFSNTTVQEQPLSLPQHMPLTSSPDHQNLRQTSAPPSAAPVSSLSPASISSQRQKPKKKLALPDKVTPLVPAVTAATILPTTPSAQNASSTATSSKKQKVTNKTSTSDAVDLMRLTRSAARSNAVESRRRTRCNTESQKVEAKETTISNQTRAHNQPTHKKKLPRPQEMSDAEWCERRDRLKEHNLVAAKKETIDLTCRIRPKPKKGKLSSDNDDGDDEEIFCDELAEWFSSKRMSPRKVLVLTSENGDRFLEFDSLLHLITPKYERTAPYEDKWNEELTKYLENPPEDKKNEAHLYNYYYLKFEGRRVTCLEESAFVDFIENVMERWLVKLPSNEVVRILARHLDQVGTAIFDERVEGEEAAEDEEESDEDDSDEDAEVKEEKEQKNEETEFKDDQMKDEEEVVKTRRSVTKRVAPAANSSSQAMPIARSDNSKKRKADVTSAADTVAQGHTHTSEEAQAAVVVTPTPTKKRRVDDHQTQERNQSEAMDEDDIKQEETAQTTLPPSYTQQSQTLLGSALPLVNEDEVMNDRPALSFSQQLQNILSSPHHTQSALIKCLAQGQAEFKQLYDFAVQNQ